MDIRIQNAGPVKKADIDLKNLVVFVGPNNAGKSFIATLMYASLSQNAVVSSVRLIRSLRRTSRLESESVDSDVEGFLEEASYHHDIPSYESMPPHIREFFSLRISDALYEFAASVTDEISRTTGVALPAIRRVAKKRAVPAVIELTSNAPAWTVTITIYADTTKTQVSIPSLEVVWSYLSPQLLGRIRRGGMPLSYLVRDFSAELIRTCFQEVPLHTKYLPAARSGILQSHKALAGSLVRRSTLAGIEDLRIPAMSGVVTDFLSEMIELNPASLGDFRTEASRLENEILHGRVGLSGEPSAYPEVHYTTTTGSYPLGRTSSMISELAPVVLYLRHLLRRRDLLFIEEPEAHLHPATQIAFARSLVRLINRGLRIVLTTHSEYFLQQLNNAIVASELNRHETARAGVSPGLGLASSMVAAYYFAPTDSGTVVANLPVDTKEGISESSFGNVSERLYNEAVALDRSAGRGEEE